VVDITPSDGISHLAIVCSEFLDFNMFSCALSLVWLIGHMVQYSLNI
jgi:hypothetical protein